MPQMIIIIVYFVIMLIIGAASRRKARRAEDFFVAGRKGSSLLVAGSLLATVVGGSATVGMAGLGFQRGLTGAWWLLAGSIGLIVLGVFFARKVRKYALFTLPELIAKQYDQRVAMASSVLIVVAWIGIIAAQIIAAGKIMSILGTGSPTLWMVVFSFIFIAYTVLGGQHSVIRTDLFQSAIIIVGIFTALGLVLSRLGGWEGLRNSLPADMFAFPISVNFGGADLASMLLVVGLTYVVGPDIYSRIFCSKDAGTARSSSLWTAGLIIPVAFAVTLIGMGAAALFPEIAAEQALPTVVSEVFSPFISGIILAALLCAMMSSADTTLLSAGTILTVDIIGGFRPSPERKNVLLRSRWLIIALGIISLAVALLLKGIISALLFAYTVYTCGVILPVIAGFFKDRLKVTASGALAALIGGGALGIASKLADVRYLDLGALAASACLLFLVSFIENRLKRRHV